MSPFGRPNRSDPPELAPRQAERAVLLRCAAPAAPERDERGTRSRASVAITLRDRGAVDAVVRDAEIAIARSTAATIVMRPAIICIHVLPSPPYQLPSASMPTAARDREQSDLHVARPSARGRRACSSTSPSTGATNGIATAATTPGDQREAEAVPREPARLVAIATADELRDEALDDEREAHRQHHERHRVEAAGRGRRDRARRRGP